MKSLANCRVLDLGIITAGAATGALLADLGAEVIKIESPTYRDPFRDWIDDPQPGDIMDAPPFFRMTNRGKYNVAIDLKSKDGREVFLDLVERSDIVLENFSRGVMERLGLGFPSLQSANPNIILASISSQGGYGPDMPYVSFGSTLEAMAGLASITGYRGGDPVVSGNDLNYPDQVAAIFSAATIATAWLGRQRGEPGVHLDISQRELTSYLCGDAFAASDSPGPEGNADESMLIQDCYRSADSSWVAVSVPQAAWPKALGLVGPDLDAGLESWISARTAQEAITALQQTGVEAALVLDGAGVLADRGTGWNMSLANLADGELVKGFLFSQGDELPTVELPAAALGQDTAAILSRVVGLDEDRIAMLAASGAVLQA